MAQSAVQKNPLNIEPFWQKASANPPTPWERWATLVEIAVYARDGIILLDLNADKPMQKFSSHRSQTTKLQLKTKPPRKPETEKFATVNAKTHG